MEKINDITFTELVLAGHAPGWWKLWMDLEVNINFESKAQWKFKILKGFITDLRSGPHLINYYVPKSADSVYNIAVCLHDANYTVNSQGKHSLSREESDELMKAMIDWGTKYAYTVKDADGKELKSLDTSTGKTKMMKWALSAFGGSHWTTSKNENSQYVEPVIIKGA